MPHRAHHFTERCSRCDRTAVGHCVRCSRVFCDEHVPDEDRRCRRCEADYAEKLAKLEKSGGKMISPLLLATTALGAAMGFATGFVPAAVGVLGLCAFASLVVVVGERSDRRNKALRPHRPEVRALREDFLAERSRLIGPGSS